jgi:hypothetical protein
MVFERIDGFVDQLGKTLRIFASELSLCLLSTLLRVFEQALALAQFLARMAQRGEDLRGLVIGTGR